MQPTDDLSRAVTATLPGRLDGDGDGGPRAHRTTTATDTSRADRDGGDGSGGGNAGFPGHLVAAADLDGPQVEELLRQAARLREMPARQARTLLDGAIVATLFFQPSTRTRLGFEAAALRLGARVTGFADPSTSRSVDYIGESLEDTARVVSELSDALVLRHYVTGAARRAAQASLCPVINGGDGSNEHPTQALSDIWTMTRRLGGLAGTVVALVGDPGTRVLRSLVHLLARMDLKRLLFLVPPAAPLDMTGLDAVTHTTLPADLAVLLHDSGTPYEFRSDVSELLAEADVVEMMPVDVPSLESHPAALSSHVYVTPERYRITAAKIRAVGSKALVLHPGPRKDELHPDVDDTPGGLYFEQVKDSLYLRMAVLTQWVAPR
ncbi:aspartate carbamoyltransferase [Streptomyces sp. NPDC059582]|uniref:aspartate/ornithine carbamoyltransferase family protein n=1 Tax=Streptomyces sp. NPDC059582 TaxID=3346875 RepID=UPI00367D43A0